MIRRPPNSPLFPYPPSSRSYTTYTSLLPERNDHLSSSGGFDLMYGYGNRRIAMTQKEIEQEIDEFAKAAKRVRAAGADGIEIDRKSTRLNSSHGYISYAVFC